MYYIYGSRASLLAQIGKESAYNAEYLGSIPRLGISHGEENGNPLQYCLLDTGVLFSSTCLENPDGQRSLAGHSPWGQKELDTTELLTHIWYQG